MFAANRRVLASVQLRCFATEAGAPAPAAGSDSKMENLLEKLANITGSDSADSTSTMISKSSNKKYSKKSNSSFSSNTNKSKSRNNRNNNNNNNSSSRDSNANGKREFKSRRQPGSKFSRNERQTVSHFDRFKNSSKGSVSAANASALNAKGLAFADLQEQKSSFIRRKVNPQASINITTPQTSVFGFVHALALYKTKKYDVKADQFAKFHEPSNAYEVEPVNRAELELLKDKIGYDTKSRVLRALEQMARKRGFKLVDTYKKNVSYLPYNATLYPFANTTLPNNLQRPVANLKNLSNISPQEMAQTISSVVKGERQEIKYDPNAKYKTDQLKVNAQVVANGLNRNCQLQVDNLHVSMSKVMLGLAPIKSLPQPILAPKKI